jgi:hypothetical protein
MGRMKEMAAEAQDRDDERTERVEGPDAVGHNKPNELTEDERRVLTYAHKRILDEIEERLEAVKAEKRRAEHQAKAELGKGAIADIKELRLYDTPKGEEAIKAALERQLRLARWANAPIGFQAKLDGMAPSENERAYELGKTAGLKGEPKVPPFHHTVPQHNEWCRGWDAGNEINLSNFRDKLIKNNAKKNGDEEADELAGQTDLEEAVKRAEADDLSIPPDLRRTTEPTADAPFHAPADDMPAAPAQPQ